jgi:hypothetical protein
MSSRAEPASSTTSRVPSEDSFPPQSARLPEIEAILEFYRGFLAPKSATYVSAPITSGRRFVQWLSREGAKFPRNGSKYRSGHAAHVVQPNREQVRLLVATVRATTQGPVIDPTSVGNIEGWTQPDFRTAWAKIIEQFVHTVVFADGWEYSNGCSYELLVAVRNQLTLLDERGAAIALPWALMRLDAAIRELDQQEVSTEFQKGLVDELRSLEAATPSVRLTPQPGDEGQTFKDAVLDRLAHHGNVAQFVSFGPDLSERYSRVIGHAPNEAFGSVENSVRVLLEAAPDRSVNVRSYHPESPKSREFIYGLQSVDDAVATVRRLAGQGLFTIVNETVDVHDGGVSGVAVGDVVEFAPDDTPRCVEKPGTASLPLKIGLAVLARVYGVDVALPFGRWRVEFSLHPLPRGYRRAHTILWESEAVSESQVAPAISWPNQFSRFIGDKTYGLLVADALGLPVPQTLVVGRAVAPFRFGRPTGSGETWLRTAPREPVPGFFSTFHGWKDPFSILQKEDPDGKALAAVLAQDGVVAEFSGAAIEIVDSEDFLVEGVQGPGADFMLGRSGPVQLPSEVRSAVSSLCHQVRSSLGSGVKLEWAFDGQLAWIVQLQRLAAKSTGRVIVPGDAAHFREFNVASGIDALRDLLSEVSASGEGVLLIGDIGITSHFGDLLRRSNVPSRLT